MTVDYAVGKCGEKEWTAERQQGTTFSLPNFASVGVGNFALPAECSVFRFTLQNFDEFLNS